MDRSTAKEIVSKILDRDYERWIQYTDENPGNSFYIWKEGKGYTEKDAQDIAEILC